MFAFLKNFFIVDSYENYSVKSMTVICILIFIIKLFLQILFSMLPPAE